MQLLPKRILVLCEGASECAYLKQLNAFFNHLPPYNGSLQLIPKPSVKSEKTGNLIGCGDGKYGVVESCYRNVKRQDPNEELEVWVDSDLYVRNDKNCLTQYNGKLPGIPDFKFSIHNFEDFLAFHANDDQYRQWKETMQNAGHFQRPLHAKDYLPLFLQIFHGYKKGRLEPICIDEASLKNLFRHMLHDLSEFNMGELTSYESFAFFLKRILIQNYPQTFRDEEGE